MGAYFNAVDVFPHSYPHYPQCYTQKKVNIYGTIPHFVHKLLTFYTHYAQVTCKSYSYNRDIKDRGCHIKYYGGLH